jgi:hypothetical protein
MSFIFVGNSKSGKDTIADILGLRKYAFADALKFCTSSCFELPIEYFYHSKYKDRPLKKFHNLTPRQLSIRFSENGFFDIPDLQVTFESYQLAIENIALRINSKRPLLGKGGVKKSSPTFWVDFLEFKLPQDKIENFVITDCRFQLEFDRFSHLDTVAIERKIKSCEDLTFLKKQCKHNFENNAASVGELREDVSAFFEKFSLSDDSCVRLVM